MNLKQAKKLRRQAVEITGGESLRNVSYIPWRNLFTVALNRLCARSVYRQLKKRARIT
jgi:hypothetical protein